MGEQQRHIDFVWLVDYADGRLAPGDLAAVEAHLARCARCAADVRWLRRTGVEPAAHSHPPPAARERVRALFRAWRRPPARQLRAELRFDSARAPAVGRRSEPAAERQLIYSAGGFDVEMRLTPSGGAWLVAGQVLGPDTAGFVEVGLADGPLRVPLTELCEFALPPLQPGRYPLTFRLGDAELSIGELALP